MSKVGIIGGITPESTILYYRILNALAANKLGDQHTAKVLVNSVDFGMISYHQQKEEWDILNNCIADAAIALEKAGASCILIGANTMHLCYDYAQEKVNIPIIHIADATSNAISKKRISKVGLLGTKYTMEKDFYKSILLDNNIQTIVPNRKEREVVHEIIYGELAKGIFTEKSKATFLEIIDNLVENGAEGVILGCTEIPLLIHQKDVNVPIFNTTEIHAIAAFEFINQ
ncbi:MAG: amino acid racemase [Flavobacteriaceae bacterium]|nr:amino acid racemase [Flavobacteriaceae bacterium]